MERQLLMEGWLPELTPTIGYVRQGGQAYFFHGQPDSLLVESVVGDIEVVSTLDKFQLVDNPLLNESVLDDLKSNYNVPDHLLQEIAEAVRAKSPKTLQKDAEWIVEGPFQKWDTKNANGRTYQYETWQWHADPKGDFMKAATARPGGILGHLEHPADGKTDGNKGAISTRGLKLLEKEKTVWGRAELLGTPPGLILMEYTRRDQRWGVSSRGNGTVTNEGTVGKDFRAQAWDAVMNPSTPGAFPTLTSAVKESAPDSESVKETKEDRKPRVQITVPDNYGKDDSLTEDVQSLVEEVRDLVETDLEHLDEAALDSLSHSLLNASLKSGGLVSAGTLESSKAVDLQNWLARKLLAVREVSDGNLSEAIDRVFESSSDDENNRDAYRQVVAALHGRLRDLSEDYQWVCSELENLTESGSDVDETEDLRKQLLAAQSLIERLRDDLQENESVVESLREQLETAQTAIEESFENTEPDDLPAKDEQVVNAAVKDVIGQEPQLESYRGALALAETAQGVYDLAEAIMPAVLAQEAQRNYNRAVEINRRTLPSPGIIVESGDVGLPGKVSKNPSSGASLAGKALTMGAKRK